MRFCLSITAALILTLLSLAACNSRDGKNAQTDSRAAATPPVATPPLPNDDVRRITIPDLQVALVKGEAVIIDVRGSVEYKLGHISGARSVPLGLIAQQIKDLPPDKLIVAYCA